MKKIVISGMIGNALEWYDYALYAQFATIIGNHFFSDSTMRETLTLAVFAAGFVVRPVGGIIFGSIGDKFGRRTALVIGIITMAIPTAGIGLLPSYETIGIAAPIILTIIRLIQGFSLGGEFSGCISYIVEHAQMQQRGIAGSVSFVSMCGGMLLGLITASGFTYFMDQQNLMQWGWRIPFVAGLFIGTIGLYIRKNLSESPIYKQAKETGRLSKFPLKEIFIKYWLELLVAIGLYITVTTPFYTATVFVVNFMKMLGYNQFQSSVVSSVILITMIIILPISAILVEIFPTSVRFTGVALSYNLAAAIFGGSAPVAGMMLAKYTGDNNAIAYYLIALALLSLFVLRFYKETFQKDLVDNNYE